MTDLFSTQLADGPGVPVVLSHALGLDCSMWDGLARHWHGRRPVLAYDHRGHGRSPAPAGPYEMEDLVADAAEVVARWRRGPVVWLGLSLGGMVGQGLAILHPRLVRGLVLAHTTSRYPQAARHAWLERIAAVRAGGLEAIADLVVERYLTGEFRAAAPNEAAALRARIVRNDPEGYCACCHAVGNVDWLARLGEIACPTLVIAGELDRGATPEMAREIHAAIAGSGLAIVEGASHLSPLEQPARFEALADAFLAGVERGARG